MTASFNFALGLDCLIKWQVKVKQILLDLQHFLTKRERERAREH